MRYCIKPSFASFACLLLLLIVSLNDVGGQEHENSCKILSLFRFSDHQDIHADADGSSLKESQGKDLGEEAYSYMAAATLAKNHFNARSPEVVPELDSLLSDCSLTIGEFWFRDGGNDPMAALSALLDIDIKSQAEEAETGNGTAQLAAKASSSEICAIIGPDSQEVVQVLAGVTELRQIPIVSNLIGTSKANSAFPSVLSNRVPESHVARAMADYFDWLEPKRSFVVSLFENEGFDMNFQERAEDELDYKVSAEPLITEGTEDRINDALDDAMDKITEKGLNTVLLSFSEPEFLPRIAEKIEEYGLFERPILWVIPASALPPHVLSNIEYDAESPMDRLLQGAAMYADYDRFLLLDDEDDAFLTSWRGQNASFVETVNSGHPLDSNHDGYFKGVPDYFQKNNPATYSSYIYDAVMLAGVSACQLEAKKRKNEDTHVDYAGGPHLAEMLLSNFRGASGSLMFGEGENEDDDEQSESQSGDILESESQDDGDTAERLAKQRNPETLALGLYNIRSKPTENGKNSYFSVLTSVYQDFEWTKVENASFLQRDGTSNPLLPIRETYSYNYLDDGLFVLGMVLMSLAVAIAIGSLAWVFLSRKKQLVRAGQPEFLYLLCFGSAMVASSIAFVSFDESSGFSEDKLSKLCGCGPWMFVIGYVIVYCALVGKLWRINKLMSRTMVRQKVQVYHALWPFAILLGCIIVLACWQAIDPFVWKRVEVDDEPYQTLGQCQSDNATPFVAALGVLIGTATALTLLTSWQTKDVQEELSESKWIFAGVFSHLQMWAIGIPLVIILDGDTASPAYMIRAALIFLFSTVMVVLVVWPKIYVVHFRREPTRAAVKVNVSGTAGPRVSGMTEKSSNMESSHRSATERACDGEVPQQ